eukprot:COSAG05_NODE_408_length_10119_cov_10.267166_6_plen_47_part_00
METDRIIRTKRVGTNGRAREDMRLMPLHERVTSSGGGGGGGSRSSR